MLIQVKVAHNDNTKNLMRWGMGTGGFWAKLGGIAADAILEFAELGFIVLGIFGLHLLTNSLLGKGFGLFGDRLPLEYVFDAAHIAVVIRFLIKILKGFK